jgi:hypothetical protein
MEWMRNERVVGTRGWTGGVTRVLWLNNTGEGRDAVVVINLRRPWLGTHSRVSQGAEVCYSHNRGRVSLTVLLKQNWWWCIATDTDTPKRVTLDIH